MMRDSKGRYVKGHPPTSGGYTEGHVPYSKIRFNEEKLFSLDKEVSYFLGLLASDGCVRPSTGRIAISLTDEQLVRDVKDALFPNHPVHKEERRDDWKTQYVLKPHSVKVARHIAEMDIKNKVPSLPDGFIHHYVRGIVDGDGSLTLQDGRFLRIDIYGKKCILEEIKKIVRDNLGLDKRKVVKGKRTFRVTYSGSQLPINVCDWMYKDADLFLERKHRVFEDFREEYKHRKYRWWTEKEIKLLKETYSNLTNRELTNIFDRSKSSINQKACELGLKKAEGIRAKAVKQGWDMRRK